MSITLPDSRALLRLALASITLALGLGRAGASEVTTPVEQLHAGLMAIMKAGKTTPFRQRYEMIAPVIGRTFDLEVILRQVIGPRLAALPPDERAAVGDAFRRYTIASYVANFDTYSGQRFEVAPVVRAAGSDRVVETQIAAWYECKTLEEEKAVIGKVNKAALDNVVYAPTGFFLSYQAWRKNVTGVVKGPLPFFWNVAKATA